MLRSKRYVDVPAHSVPVSRTASRTATTLGGPVSKAKIAAAATDAPAATARIITAHVFLSPVAI